MQAIFPHPLPDIIHPLFQGSPETLTLPQYKLLQRNPAQNSLV